MVTGGLPALSQDLENVAREFRKLIEEDTRCAPCSLRRARNRAAANEDLHPRSYGAVSGMAGADRPFRMAELR